MASSAGKQTDRRGVSRRRSWSRVIRVIGVLGAASGFGRSAILPHVLANRKNKQKTDAVVVEQTAAGRRLSGKRYIFRG